MGINKHSKKKKNKKKSKIKKVINKPNIINKNELKKKKTFFEVSQVQITHKGAKKVTNKIKNNENPSKPK